MKDLKNKKTIRQAAFDLYKPPFRFDKRGGYVWDQEDNMVVDQDDFQEMQGMLAARVRGWGRIQYLKEFDPCELQDKAGELVAEALTEFWEKNIDGGYS